MNRLLTEEFSATTNHPPKGKLVHSILSQQSLDVTSPLSSLKYVVSGEEYYRHGNRKFRLRAGDALMVKAGEKISAEIRTQSPATGLCLYFEESRFEKLDIPVLQFSTGTPFQLKSHHLSRLIETDRIAASQMKSHFQNLVELGRSAFLESADTFLKLANRHRLSAAATFQKLERTRRYIDDQNGLVGSLEELSSIASLSKHHFSRLFKEVYGQTPVQYASGKKLEYAKILLQKHNLSITELSCVVGFADQPSFSKAFKKAYGYPPSKAVSVSAKAASI